METNYFEIIQRKAHAVPMVQMKEYLSENLDIKLKSKIQKAELLDIFFKNVSQDNAVDIITAFTTCGLNYTSSEVIEALNISKYQLEKLVKNGSLTVVAKAHSEMYKSWFRLFSILEVNALKSEIKPKKKVEVTVADIEITPENLCEALYVINKSAKKSRDTKQHNYRFCHYGEVRKAKNRQNTLYDLKDRAINAMLQDGILQLKGYHTQTLEFWEATSTQYLLMYVGCGFSFHCPAKQKPKDIPLLGDMGIVPAEKTVKTRLKFKESETLLKKYIASVVS